MMNFVPSQLNMGLSGKYRSINSRVTKVSVTEINEKVDSIVSEHASKIQKILQTQESQRLNSF